MTERSKSMSTKGMDIKQSMRTHIRSNDFLFFPGDPNFWYRHKLRWWCVYFDDRSSFSRIPSRLSEKILCIDLEECNNIDLDKSIGAWLKEFQRVNGDKVNLFFLLHFTFLFVVERAFSLPYNLFSCSLLNEHFLCLTTYIPVHC